MDLQTEPVVSNKLGMVTHIWNPNTQLRQE